MKLRKTNSARDWTSSKRTLMTWRDNANDGPAREIILTTSFFPNYCNTSLTCSSCSKSGCAYWKNHKENAIQFRIVNPGNPLLASGGGAKRMVEMRRRISRKLAEGPCGWYGSAIDDCPDNGARDVCREWRNAHGPDTARRPPWTTQPRNKGRNKDHSRYQTADSPFRWQPNGALRTSTSLKSNEF